MMPTLRSKEESKQNASAADVLKQAYSYDGLSDRTRGLYSQYVKQCSYKTYKNSSSVTRGYCKHTP